MADIGLYGQLVKKGSTDSVSADLLVPTGGRIIQTAINETGDVVTLTYLDAAGVEQTKSFGSVAAASQRTVAMGWTDDTVIQDSDFTLEATGYSPQSLAIPAHSSASAYLVVWINGAAEGVSGRGLGPLSVGWELGDSMTAFGEAVAYTRGGVDGHYWRTHRLLNVGALSTIDYRIIW